MASLTQAPSRRDDTRSRSHNVRITEATHRAVSELAAQSGNSFGEIIERAVDRYRREQMFALAAEQLQAIQDDPELRAEMDAEYAMFDAVAVEALEREEW
ncbi:MAG TPA: ribbon-helix-helix protein, CopG family [Thermomicrobiales bacterium]|nr:ribbon-helix-helix protein, CopG family [Thermomicrobiales bacterium]